MAVPPGGSGNPVSAKYDALLPLVCFEDSIAWGVGSNGDGPGERLLLVGEFSAIGEAPLRPKKEASLLGPGDLGVLTMVAGSSGS